MEKTDGIFDSAISKEDEPSDILSIHDQTSGKVILYTTNLDMLIAELDNLRNTNKNPYIDWTAKPTFKQWIQTYSDISINTETVALIYDIYYHEIYHVALPTKYPSEAYITFLKFKKSLLEEKLVNDETLIEKGKIKDYDFDPATWGVVDIESSRNYIRDLQKKIDILQNNRITK